MRQVFISASFFLLLMSNIRSQNIGINTLFPDASLDVNGDLVLRSNPLLLNNGDNDSIDIGMTRFSNYRISGPTNSFNVGGLVDGVDGKFIHLYNATNYTMTLKHLSAGALPIHQINTGNGADFVLNSLSSVSMQYMAVDSTWHISSVFNELTTPSSGNWTNIGNDIINANTGNVGIGTTPVHSRLELTGTVGSSAAMFGADKFGINISANNPEIGFNYFYNGGTKTIKAGFAAMLGMSPGDGKVYLGNFGGYQSTSDFGEISNFKEVLSIKQNGNIGIHNPDTQFDLSIIGEFPLTYAGGAQFISGGMMELTNSTSQRHLYLDGGVIQSAKFTPFPYSRTSNHLLLNPYGGNIGIGTVNTNNNYKLSVNGSIRAKEVEILTGWADYVFGDEYKLRPLAEVENFIAKNKHLPEIPSQKEVEENGLKVGEVQKLMMAKIEELTLYIIAQEKRIIQLENQLNQPINKEP